MDKNKYLLAEQTGYGADNYKSGTKMADYINRNMININV